MESEIAPCRHPHRLEPDAERSGGPGARRTAPGCGAARSGPGDCRRPATKKIMDVIARKGEIQGPGGGLPFIPFLHESIGLQTV